MVAAVGYSCTPIWIGKFQYTGHGSFDPGCGGK